MDKAKKYNELLSELGKVSPYGYGHKDTDVKWESIQSELEDIRMDALDDVELYGEIERMDKLWLR